MLFETPGLSGDLALVPRFPPAVPRDPLFAARGGAVHFVIEVPDADVTGALRWPGGVLDLAGSHGYRDRWWTGILPWRLPMRDVRWGRAVALAHARTWMEADLEQGPLRWAWEDGRLVDPAPLPMSGERMLFSAPVAELAALQPGSVGRLLRRFVDPRQTRWVARTALHGADGTAVHERVAWR